MSRHLYIHVPFCDGKCHYCGFYSVMSQPNLVSLYPDLPARELDLILSHHPSWAHEPIATLYLGGGTPALLGEAGLRRMIEALRARLRLDDIQERTVELNPASVSPSLLQTLRNLGFTRANIGAQSLNNDTLRRMGRRHSATEAARAIRLAQQAGFEAVGLDLIAGLPGVTASEWRETIERALTLDPTHVSVYGLSVEAGTELARQAENGLALPDDSEQLDAVQAAETILVAAGFDRYELSNYARPGCACAHNLGIWRGNDYLGLGPAAASRIALERWTNAEDLSDYIESLTAGQEPSRARETLDAHEDAVERELFRMRLREGFDPAECARRRPTLLKRADHWETCLEHLAQRGLVERNGLRWRLTSRGCEVCDAVMRELI